MHTIKTSHHVTCLKFKFTAVASSSSSSFTSSSSSSSHTSALHHPRRPHSKHFSARQLLHLSFHNLPITEICKGSTLERRGRGRRGGEEVASEVEEWIWWPWPWPWWRGSQVEPGGLSQLCHCLHCLHWCRPQASLQECPTPSFS